MAQTFHLTAFLSLSLCLVLASAAHLSDLQSTQNRPHASAFSEDGKIVGGSYAYPGEFPYMVSIKRPWQNLQPSHWCGGALISTEYVLTAAHCVHGHSRNEYWVELGEAHRQITDGYEVEIKVDTIYEHEAFNSFTFENDVAILHLAEPANLTERIQLISIPDEGTTFQVGAMCNISGWGSTEEGAPLSVQLMKAVVPIVSREDCEDAYGWENLYEGMLCAGYYLDGGIDACAGDSGGPMVCPLEDGTNSVAGIVSWGIGCARPDYPGVYTETAYFRDWIREKTGI